MPGSIGVASTPLEAFFPARAGESIRFQFLRRQAYGVSPPNGLTPLFLVSPSLLSSGWIKVESLPALATRGIK
jgi:hypothetical protein